MISPRSAIIEKNRKSTGSYWKTVGQFLFNNYRLEMIESDINTSVANFSNQLETELNDKIKTKHEKQSALKHCCAIKCVLFVVT